MFPSLLYINICSLFFQYYFHLHLQPSSCLSDKEEDEIYGFGYGVFAPRVGRGTLTQQQHFIQQQTLQQQAQISQQQQLSLMQGGVSQHHQLQQRHPQSLQSIPPNAAHLNFVQQK